MLLEKNERIDEVNDKLKLIQKTDGLTFGTDALLLAAFTGKTAERALELGGGSGIISMLLAARKRFAKIDCLEIQEEYARLIARNVALNGLEDSLTAILGDVREFPERTSYGSYDAVFSNPPYMTVGSGKMNRSDAKYIARHEVLGTVADFASAASRILKYGGSYYVVWRPDRLPALFSALTTAGLAPKRMTPVHGDANSTPSLVLVEAKKGGAVDGFFLTKPLLLHEDTKATPLIDTQDCKFIYETGEFPNEYIRP